MITFRKSLGFADTICVDKDGEIAGIITDNEFVGNSSKGLGAKDLREIAKYMEQPIEIDRTSNFWRGNIQT